MATLRADTISRVKDDDLVALTNKDSYSATTVDVAYLDTICGDAEEVFEVETGSVYDSTNGKHVVVAVELVVILLQKATGQLKDDDEEKKMKAWREKAKRYALVGARDREAIRTSSELTTPDEVPSGETRKPDLHRSIWDAATPDQP